MTSSRFSSWRCSSWQHALGLTVLLSLGCPPAEIESEHAGCEEHEEEDGEEHAGEKSSGGGGHADEDELSDDAKAALHAAALAALVPARGQSGSCAASRCHAGEAPSAGLSLRPGITDLRKLLVGREACVAPDLMLVNGEGGEHALEHSWLWQKLTAHADSRGELQSEPEWGANAICGQRQGMPYGARMPWTGDEETLSERKLTAVRRWICAGAPGPGKKESEPDEPHEADEDDAHASDDESAEEADESADEESEMGTPRAHDD